MSSRRRRQGAGKRPATPRRATGGTPATPTTPAAPATAAVPPQPRAAVPPVVSAAGGSALRTAGIPFLAAAVVGGSATGAAAVTTPPTSAPVAPPAATGTERAGSVPQAGSRSALTAVPAAHARSAVVAKKAAKTKDVTYVVRSGDTLSEIAHRAGISLAALTRANGIRASDLIHPGQRLVLPGVKTPSPSTAKKTKRSGAKPVVHVVRAGDTLSEIALRYRITVAAIMKANHLTSTLIRPGRKLVLPGVKAAPKPRRTAAPTHVVVVRSGDTLSGIALREKVTLKQILALNHLTTRSVIHPGQKILVPGAGYPNTFAGRTYPDAVARAAAANRAILAKRRVPTREQMKALVARTAKKYKVDPALAMAIAYQESGFNQRAVSPANAIGCMQVIPSSGVWASRLVGHRLDLLDPEDNVTAGVAIIAALLRSAPDERTAIAGYYQGLGSVRKNGMFPDTRRYVANVQRLETRFR